MSVLKWWLTSWIDIADRRRQLGLPFTVDADPQHGQSNAPTSTHHPSSGLRRCCNYQTLRCPSVIWVVKKHFEGAMKGFHLKKDPKLGKFLFDRPFSCRKLTLHVIVLTAEDGLFMGTFPFHRIRVGGRLWTLFHVRHTRSSSNTPISLCHQALP